MACQVIRDEKNEIKKVLAPNGKESKLFNDILPLVDNNKAAALRLWAQVYTPTFKAWFGDSKVVDENEEPMIVYHGTANQREEFSNKTLNFGYGIYTTSNKEYADTYRRVDLDKEYSPTTMPLFLNIRSPKYISYNEYSSIAKIKQLPSDADGYIMKHDEASEMVAFNPNQIKSIFNKGSFSEYSNNIYEQRSNESPEAPRRKLMTLLDKLSSRFNIPHTFIDNQAAPLGRFVNGTVVINIAKANAETAFHEFLHPFILTLEKENPQLYNDLAKELETTIDGLKAISQVRREYADLNDRDQRHEAIVNYLGKLSQIKYDIPKSPFNRFIEWIKRLFKKIRLIDFKNLSLNTTLSDISDMIVDDLYTAEINAQVEDSKVLTRDQRDTELTYKQVFDRVKDKINILSATLRRRKQGEQFKEDIEALQNIFSSADEVASINSFVGNALQYVDSVYNRFNTLRDNIKNNAKLSQEDITYNLGVLGEIQQLLNVYESLQDIQLLYVKEGVKSTDDTMAKLGEAIIKNKLIVEDFKPFALSYLTEWLYPYIEQTNKQLEKEFPEQLLTKEKFREQVSIALTDISAAGYWLGATINSQDPVSAAIGLALKDVVYEAHLKDIKSAKILQDAYREVEGTPMFTTKSGITEFNMQFLKEVDNYEVIGKNEDGSDQYGFIRRLALHTPYNDDQYQKNRIEFFQSLGDKPKASDGLKWQAYNQKITQWYAKNTQIDPSAKDIIAEKQKNMSKRQFQRWILENTKQIDEMHYMTGVARSDYFKARNMFYSANPKNGTFRIYSGELIKPAEMYKNKEFSKMMKNPYYKTLYTQYKQANDKLGIYGLRYGIIPQVPKASPLIDTKKSVKENIINVLKAPIRSVKADPESSRTIQRQDGSEVRRIPIQFTSMVNAENLDINLVSSVMKYTQMANNFEGFTEIEPNILILKTILNGDFNLGIEGRKVSKTNAKGRIIINSITNKVVPKLVKNDKLNARLTDFIDDIVYGDDEFQIIANIKGRDLSINKMAGKLGLFTAVSTMALNFNGGISNLVVGNFNNMIEAFGGRFWGKRDWAWAHKEYWANIHHSLGSLSGAESMFTYLTDHYDVPQGEFKNEFGNDVGKGQVNKYMKTNSLMFIQNGTEHEIQVTGMLSLMKATEVTTKDGRKLNLYTAWQESSKDGNYISPFENPDINWTAEDDNAFRNRLHAITKTLQGIYNKFDKSVLSRHWAGKLAIMFRKYMFSSIKARYGAQYIDYELGTIQEGYWNTFKNKLYKDAKDYKWGMFQRMYTKEGYNSVQAAAINKTLFELAVVVSAFILAGLSDTDDDDTWITNEVALQLTRFSADITQYINPIDFLRVIRNPAASINTIEKILNVLAQLFHPTEVYTRSAGIAKKGDNKLYIKTLKLLPVTRQIVNMLTPEEQIKFYRMSGTR